jgi:predicted TIM-barrel fold metal-dependent hydrolase
LSRRTVFASAFLPAAPGFSPSWEAVAQRFCSGRPAPSWKKSCRDAAGDKARACLQRYPNLKIIASRSGGTLPYLVGRFEKGDEVEIPSRRQMKRKPTNYLRHIYYDCITYDLSPLQYLISVVGANRVMFGTDCPHQVHDTKGAFTNTSRLPPERMAAVRSGSARRISGL